MRKQLAEQLPQLISQVSTIVVGKRTQIEDCVACLLAGGHLLIEDVPGVGKTTLAHALAVSLGLRFSRTQFTADLMPADLIGVSIYERAKEAFVFHPGPVFRSGLARRRNQSRRAEDPERPARSDGRAPGQRRR